MKIWTSALDGLVAMVNGYPFHYQGYAVLRRRISVGDGLLVCPVSLNGHGIWWLPGGNRIPG